MGDRQNREGMMPPINGTISLALTPPTVRVGRKIAANAAALFSVKLHRILVDAADQGRGR